MLTLSPTDAAENRALLAGAIAALPLDGGELALPAGTYPFGGSATGAAITLVRDHVTLRGAGLGRTVLTYASSSATGDVGPGSAILIGDGLHTYRDVAICDLTLVDGNPLPISGAGHNPSAIDAYRVDHVRIERVEIVDAKGNAAITVVGVGGDGSMPPNEHLAIRDCILRGAAAGGWIEGDGINAANMRHVVIEGNRIEGVRRHAIEGGFVWYFRIADNTADMLSQGMCFIGAGTFCHGQITGNVVSNLRSDPSMAFWQVGQDAPSVPVGDVVVSGNILRDAGNARFLLWQILGDDVGVGPVVVSDNLIESRSPIQIFSPPVQFRIANNVANMLGGVGPFVGTMGAGPALGPNEFLHVAGNTLTNVSTGIPGARVVQSLTTAVNWKSPRVRCHDNLIGSSESDARTGQADGGWALDWANLPPIAAGAVSARRAVPCPGALLGDVVEATGYAPDGVTLVATVQAPDQIVWHLANGSAVAVDPPMTGYTFRINRR